MRARFTAHATQNYEFVHRTYRGTAKFPYQALEDTPPTQWTRLVVHSHSPAVTADIAHVDFSAYGMEQGQEMVLHEKAEFAREGDTWIYTRPLREGPAPVRSATPKVGRNDPCPCGSGKKFKHCCGR
jgi:SEC-C motif-containing protein